MMLSSGMVGSMDEEGTTPTKRTVWNSSHTLKHKRMGKSIQRYFFKYIASTKKRARCDFYNVPFWVFLIRVSSVPRKDIQSLDFLLFRSADEFAHFLILSSISDKTAISVCNSDILVICSITERRLDP